MASFHRGIDDYRSIHNLHERTRELSNSSKGQILPTLLNWIGPFIHHFFFVLSKSRSELKNWSIYHSMHFSTLLLVESLTRDLQIRRPTNNGLLKCYVVREMFSVSAIFQKNCQEKMRWNYLSWELYLNCSLRCPYLFFAFIVWMMKIKRIHSKTMEANTMPVLVFRRGHLRSNFGIICRAVQILTEHAWSITHISHTIGQNGWEVQNKSEKLPFLGNWEWFRAELVLVPALNSQKSHYYKNNAIVFWIIL